MFPVAVAAATAVVAVSEVLLSYHVPSEVQEKKFFLDAINTHEIADTDSVVLFCQGRFIFYSIVTVASVPLRSASTKSSDRAVAHEAAQDPAHAPKRPVHVSGKRNKSEVSSLDHQHHPNVRTMSVSVRAWLVSGVGVYVQP